ncbi:hypothetical protein SKAU_G00252070 [Synaphobranchus kaupii]|uniref:Uncharacterized protein n=1 Tax=Synaphobranchus kaupii TaxID=118154 RepID=A0A9Q1IS03_SYNKA|nr:hypothetical protein SKAU_G00252070 [Synaphobranchus kaupii]
MDVNLTRAMGEFLNLLSKLLLLSVHRHETDLSHAAEEAMGYQVQGTVLPGQEGHCQVSSEIPARQMEQWIETRKEILQSNQWPFFPLVCGVFLIIIPLRNPASAGTFALGCMRSPARSTCRKAAPKFHYASIRLDGSSLPRCDLWKDSPHPPNLAPYSLTNGHLS